MKIITILAIVMVAFNIAQAQAESCEGGTFQTGDNGHVYCQSNDGMNWWSAYTWCEAQGRHLATMYEVCPEWDGSTGGGKSCNMNSFSNNQYNWSATARNTDEAFWLDRGTIGSASRNGLYYRMALCY